MPKSITISRHDFMDDRQGRTFADILQRDESPFSEVLLFFNNEARQQRLEDSEIHHDRPALAGVVRELESLPSVHRFLTSADSSIGKRLRQAVGVLVRIIMERRGWRKTGKKGSLGVRATASRKMPNHNTGGLALWFLRAERYERPEGMPFRTARERCQELESGSRSKSQAKSRNHSRVRTNGRIS
jgi:hypothetical protein